MRFVEAVGTLSIIHNGIWFYAETGVNDLTHCDKWRHGEIRSTGGTLLAMQIGHPDEWQYTPFCEKQDTGLIIDEPDENSAITVAFLRDVRFWMETHVYPYIDDNGVFTPPEEDPDWKW